jgi:hypothetical protein
MRSLDRCTSCQVGTMKIYTTRTQGLVRLRYLRCTACGSKGKECFSVDSLGRQTSFAVGTTRSTCEPSLAQHPSHNE